MMKRAVTILFLGGVICAALWSIATSIANGQSRMSRYNVSFPMGKARAAYALPPVLSPQGMSKAEAAALPLVVIDAGHGGHDPGSVSPETGRHEKSVTLAVARKAAQELLASGKVRVALTRDDDRYLILEERYGIARKLGANLFISIHADSAENHEARGASIYTLSEVASDKEADKLAARENRSNLISGIDLGNQSQTVGNILIDLTQRETMDISTEFAKILQREASETGVRFRGGAHHFAGFVVLKSPDVPSVFFETGYISNKNDEAFIASDEGRDALANGIRQAVIVHFARQSRPIE